MPPPWRVLIGHTGHHFWKRQEYIVGLLMETRAIDLPISHLKRIYKQATSNPPGVGCAVLVEKCTEKKAKDIVEELQEFGLVCMAEEIETEEEPEASG
mmetsp:Transcript_108084/g.232916  ORF Transcript_108084/g.232916 Transcript_108084/m.232916 type:complete len:98 (-) Transcript_108084:232-525(-)